MAKAIKKPIVVDVALWNPNSRGSNKSRWPKSHQKCKEFLVSCITLGLFIPTLEETMIASPGDYIIRGVNGEFYPCKPSIFHKTYSLVVRGRHAKRSHRTVSRNRK